LPEHGTENLLLGAGVVVAQDHPQGKSEKILDQEGKNLLKEIIVYPVDLPIVQDHQGIDEPSSLDCVGRRCGKKGAAERDLFAEDGHVYQCVFIIDQVIIRESHRSKAAGELVKQIAVVACLVAPGDRGVLHRAKEVVLPKLDDERNIDMLGSFQLGSMPISRKAISK
jgi:hypothetical protein